MKFLDQLERKFSKYAIHNLMYYVVICQVVGLVVSTIAPNLLYKYLSLNMYGIINDLQIWRLVTFVIVPGPVSTNGIYLLLTAVNLYFMYYFGRNLESIWGSVRFNLYYLSGVLLNILAAFILYLLSGNELIQAYNGLRFGLFGLYYVNMTLIMLCSFMFGDATVLFQFVIPIKMKYLGIFYAVELLVDMVQSFRGGSISQGVVIFVALLNFAIFYLATRRRKTFSYSAKQARRRKRYQEQMRNANTNGPRHRCSVCGKTELDDPNLEFRYCSRCEGNYEYCMEHLFTHEHVKRH